MIDILTRKNTRKSPLINLLKMQCWILTGVWRGGSAHNYLNIRWASFSGHFGGPSFSWLRDAEMQHMISLIYAYTYPENWSLFPSECWYWLRICLNSAFQEMTSTISLDTWIVFIKDIAIFRADGERVFFQLLDILCPSIP